MGLLKRHKRARPVYVKSPEEQEFDKMFDDLLKEWPEDRIWRTSSSGTYVPMVKSKTQPPKPVDPIEAAADDTLIFELIKRGYAVAKMPAEELAKAAE